MLDDDEVFLWLEKRSRDQRQRLIEMLQAEGREDLVESLEARMRDIETGVYGARVTWNALSSTQRRLIERLLQGDRRSDGVRESTFKNLLARGLVQSDGAELKLTERGRFIATHGTQEPPSGNQYANR